MIKIEGYKCIEMLTAFIEKTSLKPSTLLVAKEETFHLFSEVCKQLGIMLKMTDRLVYVEEAKSGMREFFQNMM